MFLSTDILITLKDNHIYELLMHDKIKLFVNNSNRIVLWKYENNAVKLQPKYNPDLVINHCVWYCEFNFGVINFSIKPDLLPLNKIVVYLLYMKLSNSRKLLELIRNEFLSKNQKFRTYFNAIIERN